MPGLSDGGVQQTYLGYLTDIHRFYDQFGVAQKKMQFEGAVRAVANQANIPVPTMRWEAGIGGYFQVGTWTLVMPEEAVTTSLVGLPIRKWLYHSTTPYHEMRHCEQFFLMAQAMMSGAVATPTKFGARSVVSGPAQKKGEALVALGFPMIVVVKADQTKASFRQSDIPMVRAWVDSIFGSAGKARNQTLTHLGKGNKHFQSYINLPEEADAWRTEREVSRSFRQNLVDAGTDDSLTSLATLFA